MKRTKEEAEQTRIKLLDIAMKEFLKHGIDRTTLSTIAKASGFTRGGLLTLQR